MNNMCSYSTPYSYNSVNLQDSARQTEHKTSNNRSFDVEQSNGINNDLFSISGDRLEMFGISINIDDLIILIMIFFMFKDGNVDYSILIILALILFDQS